MKRKRDRVISRVGEVISRTRGTDAIRRASWVCAAGMMIAASGTSWGAASPVSGTLFYTTDFAGGTAATVDKVAFTYTPGTTSITLTPSLVTTLVSGQNADGIIFDSGGNLLVGSAGINIPLLGLSGTNEIIKFSQTGTQLGTATVPSGPFHLTLSPDNSTVFSGGSLGSNLAGDNSGPLVSMLANLSGAATTVPLTGATTTLTQIAFSPTLPSTTAFYTSSPATGSGTYGTVNLSTGVTTQLGTSDNAHGIFYDSFSKTIIMVGGAQIQELNATTGASLGFLSVPNSTGSTVLDQGSSDGLGQLFVGDNNGNLAVVDLTGTSGSLNGATVFEQFLQTNLDDLAPLDSFGPPVTTASPPSPPPTSPPPVSPPPPVGVPLPAGAWMGLTVLAPMVAGYWRRRRSQA